MKQLEKKLRPLVFLIALLHPHSNLRSEGNDLINRYDINLEIDPVNQSISAEVQLDLNLSDSGIDTIVLFLHNELSIVSIEPKHAVDFNFIKKDECPYYFMKNACPLRIIFKENNEENLILHIKYRGPLKDIAWRTTNMLTTNWIELGNYSAWFPYNPEYGNFRYKIQLSIQDGYKVSGMGEITRIDGKWEILQDHLINDIVIVASKELKSIHYLDQQYQIQIDYLLLEDEKATELIEQAKFILQLYNDWFVQKKESYTIVVVPPFPDRGSYFRRGFIALLQPVPGSESDITTFKLLAHEFAHDWWSGANTNNWEDWLNESFAEYSSLMAIRQKYGQDIFNDWIHYKTFSSNFAEPVIGYNDNTRTSYTTRYDKGPVALYHLENSLGKEKFIKVLNDISNSQFKTTNALLDKLKVLTSPKERESFEKELKE